MTALRGATLPHEHGMLHTKPWATISSRIATQARAPAAGQPRDARAVQSEKQEAVSHILMGGVARMLALRWQYEKQAAVSWASQKMRPGYCRSRGTTGAGAVVDCAAAWPAARRRSPGSSTSCSATAARARRRAA
eukprot:CAMPEP_0197941384 /NCGR_PEP_ID=MMETSP1439-20131203/122716_1 /TAXON_ID=66791 /ORGANISM="Gonyaulax spinifera, Strain CCMP409" /LENGTH=134 /DNA_ID=CAMNT_0043564581 /DNA_START=100 /DNA_END=501 /DNA_ORIENTATION=-